MPERMHVNVQECDDTLTLTEAAATAMLRWWRRRLPVLQCVELPSHIVQSEVRPPLRSCLTLQL